MEGKKTCVLLFFLHVFNVMTQTCPERSTKDLSCSNDFNHTMVCVWTRSESPCSVRAEYDEEGFSPFSASCDLTSLKNCSLIFDWHYIFHETQNVSVTVTCNHVKKMTMSYLPRCHVKVKLGKPEVNISTVSWFFEHRYLKVWSHELQWKQHEQPWSEAKELKQDNGEFKEELQHQWMISGQKYEARVRMKINEKDFLGPWSDWSPTVSWVSSVGGSGGNNRHMTSDPNATFAANVWQIAVGGVALVVLMILVILHRRDKTIWVYLVKKIQGAPVPTPAKSFLQNTWLNPPFPSESFLPPDVEPVEVTSPVDVVSCCRLNTDFSNPTYSMLYTDGNLDPCPSDSPYGPGLTKDQERSPEREKPTMESGRMSLDVEEAPRTGLERPRFRSLDSGVSEESMEHQDQIKDRVQPIQMYCDYESAPDQDKSAESAHPQLPHPPTSQLLSLSCSLQAFVLMSSVGSVGPSVGSVEPSGDGYRPFKQED